MGSSWFCNQSRGKTITEAYNNAVEDAADENGHQQGYSGDINSTHGFRDITKEFKASKKSLNVFINEQEDRLTKHDDAQAICIEEPIANKNTIKSQVEHIVTAGTKKWVLKYRVNADWRDDSTIGSYLTKGDAVKAARAHTEKTQESTFIDMVKVLEKGPSKVAKISYKGSSTERDGVWVFFGWASC
jgi:hypothetical protein